MWAVVTGASDGIGKEFALKLASEGFSVLLVSRSADKLEAVASAIRDAGGEARVHVLDFAATTPAALATFTALVRSLDVGVLVSNAGLNHEYPKRLLDEEPERVRDIVRVNVSAFTDVTLAVLPCLVKHAAASPSSRALLIALSSAGGIMPTPLLATYSGTKAYVNAFSASLAAEYARARVDVETHVPLFVVSKMSKRSRPSLFIPSAAAYVRAALGSVGHGDWVARSPYWAHAAIFFALDCVPRYFARFVIQRNLVMHEDIARRAVRKAQRQAAAAAGGGGEGEDAKASSKKKK